MYAHAEIYKDNFCSNCIKEVKLRYKSSATAELARDADDVDFSVDDVRKT